MKNRKKLVALVLGVSVIFSSVLMTSGMAATTSVNSTSVLASASVDKNFNDIVLSPGADSSQLNFNWYSSNSNAKPVVQVALKSDVTGTDFPVSKAQTFGGQTSVGNNGFTANKVSTTGYKLNTQYVYRLGDGTNWSATYSYNTYNKNSYSFLFAGDPQIGAGGDISKDSAGWVDTLNKATKLFTDNSFMISVGDQINNGKELNGASNESEYTGYFAPEQLKSLPVASIAGNHETYGPGHKTHFDAPNLSDKYGSFDAGLSGGNKDSGTDYYFTYNNTLYLMLNSNDVNEGEHQQFMQDAIAKNPSATWKVVVLHHSIYSSADHETDADIIQRRVDLPPIFDSLGIDVVLDGHDHCYTRTYQMKGGQAIKAQNVDAQGRVVDATGTLYITANSASGSKYYEMQQPGTNNFYEAKKEQIKVPTFSRVTVSSNSFTITTYRTDTMTQTDSYTLLKSTKPDVSSANVIDQINSLPASSAITLNDKNNVQNARIAYTALSADEQKLVTNITSLSDDETQIASIEAAAVKAADQQAAATVIAKIDAIPQNVALSDKETVTALRTAYNALTDAQKALVTNYNKLTTAESTITKLQTPAVTTTPATTATTATATPISRVTTTSSTLPKTGQFVDESVLMALGLVLIIAGSSVILISRKRKRV